MVIGSHDFPFPTFSGWKPGFSAVKQYLADN
jgi:hypothetical protein